MSASKDKSVRIWNSNSRESITLLNALKPIVSITVAHNKIVMHSKKSVHIYNRPDVELLICGRPGSQHATQLLVKI